MKRFFACLLAAAVLFSCAALAEEPGVSAKSVLLAEVSTGQVLYEQNADQRLPIASVTKVMTLLLICEELESGRCTLEDTVTASTVASNMGGSQIYLKEGEQMPLEELLKSVVIASANDAATALAEYVGGSLGVFVENMNRKAAELGMENTHFVNCTGLPAEDHYSTARDVAIMSRALLGHEQVRKYTTTWLDSIRGGEFTLTNTNKMIRSYNGMTGLKTGYTVEAGFCVSAAALRDGMELVAVVLGSETGEKRFRTAANLLDYGFAGWTVTDPSENIEQRALPVRLGEQDYIMPRLSSSARLVAEKARCGEIKTELSFPDEISAPVKAGQKVGTLTLTLDGAVLLTADYVAPEDVPKLGRGRVLLLCLEKLFV